MDTPSLESRVSTLERELLGEPGEGRAGGVVYRLLAIERIAKAQLRIAYVIASALSAKIAVDYGLAQLPPIVTGG